MRARLLSVLIPLIALVLVTLSLPLASNLAAARQQTMFLDRLQDTGMFASLSQQSADQLDTQVLAEDLVRYGDVYGVQAAVLDRTGAPRAASSPSLDLRSPQVAAEIRQALAGHQSVNPDTIWPWADRPLVVGVPVVRNGEVIGAVVTVSPTTGLRAGTSRELAVIGLAAMAALGLCVAVAFMLATWVLRPVYVLGEAAGQIRTGELSTRVAPSGPVELRTLAASFNDMAHAVEDTLRRQRSFVADASHQLRNPLTALGLRLESLRDDLDGPHRGELTAVQEEADRLRMVVEELLELATAQNTRARPVDLDVRALLTGRATAWSTLARRKDVTFRYEGLTRRLAFADPALTGSALDAVLDNAIKFSPDGADITLGAREERGIVCLTVTDLGPGLLPQEQQWIGRRFWRSPTSQDLPGSGLGLSIARTLLDATGGQLAFAPAQPQGLRVSIRLPAAPAEPAPWKAEQTA
ncbi:HAMP domain-containing sensor histidine kinase [Rugosimonospora acidiphila]|uniref:histidine kinase n=1 Tax=Rugosimonospora acidiphila TaxID=556531 RepID=A0ABP9SRR9_9ACTN